MKSQENVFKDKIFKLPADNIARVKVIESYKTLCLCEISRGKNKELAIFRADNLEGKTHLTPIPYNYAGPGEETRLLAPDNVVLSRYEKMITKTKVAEFETEVKQDRAIREAEATKKAAELKTENLINIKTRQTEIDAELRELVKSNNVKKMIADKKVMSLISDYYAMELIKKHLLKN
jgi:hypothetical protein